MKPRQPIRPRYRKPVSVERQRERGVNLSRFRAQCRRDLYDALRVQHDGQVPCFCCGKHVTWTDASLEHVIPLARGGRDVLGNYAISHEKCNNRRGAPEV